jgi:hypothetical protein
MSKFESYALDQFPLRDKFRSIKALNATYVFNQKDNNDLYVFDGYISKLEYPMNEYMLTNAADNFRYIYDKYLDGMDVYFSIIPDKNYFLAESSGHLSMDYDSLVEKMREETEFMEYIDIFPYLTIDDYYRTDTHWQQNKILPVANEIANTMGVTISSDFTETTLDSPFYGVYYGQAALPFKPDTITYLENDMTDNFAVTNYNTGKPQSAVLYDFTKEGSRDPYEFFLSGSNAIVTIENPDVATGELIMFSDSFGNSLATILATAYSKVTVVDIRYVSKTILDQFVEFDNQDVLFIYSTLLLNNSTAFG